MSRARVFGCCGLLLAVACGGQPAPPPATGSTRPATAVSANDPERLARTFVEAMASHDWKGASALLDPSLKAASPEKKLEAFWTPLEAGGTWKGVAGVAVHPQDQVLIALVSCRFEQSSRLVRITIDGRGKVAGLFEGSLADLAESDSRAFVEALASGNTALAHKRLNVKLRVSVTEKDLAALWQDVEREAGAFREIERVHVVRDANPPSLRALVHARYEKGSRIMSIGYDADAAVAGLKILPPDADPTWEAPPYVKQDAFVERPVEVGNAPALPGTLSMPKSSGNVPGVVLLHGAGPQDQDGKLGAVRPLKDLAWGLASRGIAVLRYDKRTAGIVTEKEEVLDGANAAVALLRKTPGVDPSAIFIVGHDQGGALAPRLAKDDLRIAGLVIMAGRTHSLQDNVIDQFEYFSSLKPNDSALRGQVEAWKRLKRQVEDPSLKPEAKIELPTGGTLSGAYFLQARGYHPERVAATLNIPILVLQGERDYQVKPIQFQEWKSALNGRPKVKLRSYPGLNHAFVAGDGPSSPADYERSGHVDARVLQDIADFIHPMAH
jgi:dienelactone hydrolase